MGRQTALMIDANDLHYDLLVSLIAHAKISLKLVRALDPDKAEKLLAGRQFDLILSEFFESDKNLEWIARLKACAGSAPLLILTSRVDHQKAVAAVKMGVEDYLIKNRELMRSLPRTLNRLLNRKREKKRALSEPGTGTLALLGDSIKLLSQFLNQPKAGLMKGRQHLKKLEKELEKAKKTITNWMG